MKKLYIASSWRNAYQPSIVLITEAELRAWLTSLSAPEKIVLQEGQKVMSRP